MTGIGESCFLGCSSLEYAAIGSGIHLLPDGCFEDCSALPGIVIPATVDTVGNNAFRGCTSLAYVTMADREEEVSGAEQPPEPETGAPEQSEQE